MNLLTQGLLLCIIPIGIQKYCYFSHLKIKRYIFWPHFSLQRSLLCSPFFEKLVYTQFPIYFFPFSLEPITFRLLPWHITNMVLVNNINDVHALHLTCPFSSIWHHSLGSFLSHSFYLTPRTPYFLGLPSPHWLLRQSPFAGFWFLTTTGEPQGLVLGFLLCHSLRDLIQPHVFNIISIWWLLHF